MKTLLLALISVLCLSCTGHKATQFSKGYSAKNYLKNLQKRKSVIDRMPEKDTGALMVFVKISNKNELVRIFNGRFPEDSIECTYNVLTDKGKVIMIMAYPFSESGDWDVEWAHYFNADGHTFAFERQANAFALPADGIAYETITDYFSPDFNRIKHSYKLVDRNKKPLDKVYAFDRGNFDSKVYPTANECLKAYHIIIDK
jgi:hypothetical protein